MRFNIIYGDPPWPYRDKRGNDPAWGGITYPTMTLAEIKALDVGSIAAENCGLFLWTTMPFIPDGVEVMRKWGFGYVTTAFVWVKLNPSGVGIYSGLGNWTNSNVELVLFGRKGRLIRQARNVKQVLTCPVGRHSAKPAEVRDRIVALLGEVPRVELFAREKAEGWEVWGNEIKNTVEL